MPSDEIMLKYLKSKYSREDSTSLSSYSGVREQGRDESTHAETLNRNLYIWMLSLWMELINWEDLDFSHPPSHVNGMSQTFMQNIAIIDLLKILNTTIDLDA